MKFKISDDLSLGADLVVSTAGIFATKGLGKTHIAQVMAEEMLEHGQTIIAIDPTDAWYGLRSSADGKHDGYPIYVFGGDHGDLPLETGPGSAVELAESVVAERFSCVICTDGLSDMAETKFVREFLDAIYRKNREPIHIFVDEADVFAPQKPFDVEDARCIRAMSHIVRRGRKKGIGSTLITQRPAELNASVRTMIEMLFVLGMSHNLDIDAVEKWLRLRKKKHGNNAAFALQEQMIESLDSLQQGDGWVWAPRLKIHKRLRARAKRTFDSGATPKPGQKRKEAKRLAPVDLARLGDKMKAAVARQKENDPTELKKQVVQLRKELEHVGRGQDRAEANDKANHATNLELRTKLAELQKAPKIDLGKLEKIVARAQAVLEKHDAAVSRHHEAYQEALEKYTTSSKAVVSATQVAIDQLRSTLRQKSWNGLCPAGTHGLDYEGQACDICARAKLAPPRATLPRAAKPVNGAHVNGTGTAPDGLTPAHMRLLSAIAWWESLGISAPDLTGVAFVAGTSAKSSSFENNRSWLRARGYINYPSSGHVELTDAGRALAPPPILPATNGALQEAVLRKVSPAVGRLLNVLIDNYPNEVSFEDLADLAGTSPASSSFENNRSWLRARGLSEYPRKGFARATKLLFPEGS